jgi:hypothetical protein
LTPSTKLVYLAGAAVDVETLLKKKRRESDQLPLVDPSYAGISTKHNQLDRQELVLTKSRLAAVESLGLYVLTLQSAVHWFTSMIGSQTYNACQVSQGS